MDQFNITASNFHWITGAADDPEDKCLHGHVCVTIGGKSFEADGTISATALYLLKSLTEDHIPTQHDLQMVPCCGHFYVANDDLTEVTIIGCDTGLDWSIRHDGRTVLLTAPDGTLADVPYGDYLYKVCRFADQVERYYDRCAQKVISDDEFEKNGYATEAYAAACDYALYTIGMNVIRGKCMKENLASQKMLSAILRPDGEDDTYFYFKKTV